MIRKKQFEINKKTFCTTSQLKHADKEDTLSHDEYVLDHKKTYYKKDLRRQVLKQTFDEDKIFTDDNIFTEKDKIYKERVDISDEKKRLEFDLKCANRGIEAVSDMVQNKTPKKINFESYTHTLNSYEAFFEEEFSKDAKEFKEVKDYIKEELASNKARLKELKSLFNEDVNKSNEKLKKRKFDYIDEGEESERSHKSMSIDEEKSYKSMSVDAEGSTSRKSPGTPGDFIDQLPTEYNPFDDIGSD